MVKEEEEEHDWLYAVMVDIVTTHNEFIASIHSQLHAQTVSRLRLADQPTEVLLTEVNKHDCLFGEFTRWLTLKDAFVQ